MLTYDLELDQYRRLSIPAIRLDQEVVVMMAYLEAFYLTAARYEKNVGTGNVKLNLILIRLEST